LHSFRFDFHQQITRTPLISSYHDGNEICGGGCGNPVGMDFDDEVVEPSASTNATTHESTASRRDNRIAILSDQRPEESK
jgi:hypothetical protein